MSNYNQTQCVVLNYNNKFYVLILFTALALYFKFFVVVYVIAGEKTPHFLHIYDYKTVCNIKKFLTIGNKSISEREIQEFINKYLSDSFKFSTCYKTCFPNLTFAYIEVKYEYEVICVDNLTE